MKRLSATASRYFALGVLIAASVIAGCSGGKNYTDEDWEKVKLGMTIEEVEKILGPGEKIQQSDYKNFPGHVQADTFRRWKPSAKRTAWVAFKDGKLVAKQEERQGG
jgi:hypothetical protein